MSAHLVVSSLADILHDTRESADRSARLIAFTRSVAAILASRLGKRQEAIEIDPGEKVGTSRG